MKHEIIIKNGIAGVEINGRFYTHTSQNGYYYRAIDTACIEGLSHYAMALGGNIEEVFHLADGLLTEIPNPALTWPAGTKVMVRNSDQCEWVGRVFHSVDDGDILCEVPKSKTMVDDWKQCKLSEGER